MKILLVTRYFPPLESIATNRMTAWVKYFHRMGHDVTVCTTEKSQSVQHSAGINVLEIPYFDPISFAGGQRIKQSQSKVSNGLLSLYRRRFNERMPGRTDLWIWPAIQRLKKEEGFDLIISSYGPPSAHMIGLWAKKHFGCPWFADFRDLWVKNHNYKGIWPFTMLERHLEKKVMKHADIVTTVSDGLKGVLQQQYPDADVRVISNGFDPELYPEVSQKKNQKFSLVYTGTLFEGKHNAEPLCQALQAMRKKNLQVLFYGSATHYLNRLVDKYNLGSMIKIMGTVSHQEILKVQLEADAFLQIEFEHGKYDGLVSGKIYEYLYADKPILALGVKEASELGQLITKARGGILCENSPLQIEKALSSLIDGEDHQSDREFIQRFSRKHHAEVIISWTLKVSHRAMSCSL